MLSIINSSNLMGIDSFIVKVEVDITNGIPSFHIVGLAGTEVKESRERVKSAIINSGFKYPVCRIVVNLSPADLKKEGVFLDLSICIGILRDKLKVNDEYMSESLFIGEISLDGTVKRVRGILPILSGAKERGVKRVFIPSENYRESNFIKDIDIIPVRNLSECIEILNKKKNVEAILNEIKLLESKNSYKRFITYDEDFSDIKGNYFLKRCAEICACGNHNMFMIGPPGSGKTMLAKRIRTIMPVLSREEDLEVRKIYSIVGVDFDSKFIQRPFRSPHHTTTKISLVGGGVGAGPGEITLAHRGVLFLDEIAEFDRRTLEALRQPIEDKRVNISRLKLNVNYPCNMLVIAAMNPCPCGYFKSNIECRCRNYEIERYISRISGPLLDRFDIFVEVGHISLDEMISTTKQEDSVTIRQRVERGKYIQLDRFKGSEIKSNSEIKSSKLYNYCKLNDEARKIISFIYKKYSLSNRSYTKLIKVSRTIADLDERELIGAEDIIEAFSFRKDFYNYFGRGDIDG